MEVYWDNEVILKTGSKTIQRLGQRIPTNKLIYLPNLYMFVENNKDSIKFDDGFALSNKEGISQYAYMRCGSTEWRLVDGIETKEKFKEVIDFCKKNWKKFRIEDIIEFNMARIGQKFFKHLFEYSVENENGKVIKKNLFAPQYRELCYNDEDLFKDLSSSLLYGYIYKNVEENRTYNSVFNHDIGSNHQSIMYAKKFPKKITKVLNKNKYDRVIREQNFYGYFHIKVNQHNDYLYQFGNYNAKNKTLSGCFSNIDFASIKILGEGMSYECERLWKVELDYLPEKWRNAIKYGYYLKEKTAKGSIEREIVKKGYEKSIYGDSCTKRFYPIIYKWNQEGQKFEKTKNQYDWNKIQQTILNGRGGSKHIDLTVAVWTCMYARLRLIQLIQMFGDNCLYGDVDSIKFIGEENVAIVEKFNEMIKEEIRKSPNYDERLNELGFGQLRFEGLAKEFKVVDFKWYCYRTENDLVVKCSGADPKIVKEYLETLPIEEQVKAFSKHFPYGVNPYKDIRRNEDGKLEIYYRGGTFDDLTYSDNKEVIVSCAGSAKTTTLIDKVIKKYNSICVHSPYERIYVIAFTNKNVEDIKKKIKLKLDKIPFQISVQTIDSLADQVLEGTYRGDNFKLKLSAATDLLQRYKDKVINKCHLFVDEFQDLDVDKINFISSIPCISRFYIGDPNQSIYGYSGAQNFFKSLKGFKVEHRNINYRCPQVINDYAEGFLSESNRPHADCLNKGGLVNFVSIIPEDDSVILCRTNNEVNIIKELYPNREVMTIHKSKGLTFSKVTVIGISKEKNTEEEQNIAYVACTRPNQVLNVYIGNITEVI